MGDFVLSCCTTADLPLERLKTRDISYTFFHFTLNGKEYSDDMWKSISPEELYMRMLAGEDSKTSQVTIGQYTEYFKAMLDEGKDVLHLTLSSGISGSYNSACIAAKDLTEEYPERKIYIVDSLAASSGYGLLMETLADMRDAGMEIDELHQWAEANKLRVQHLVFSTDLTFYIRGGRVSKTTGMIGNVLNMCPTINVDRNGKLVPRENVRGKKRVSKRIVEKMKVLADRGVDYDGKCYISHSVCLDDADAVANLVEETFPKLKGKIEIFPIGATIGSHTGPGTVALFFWGSERKE